MSDVLDMVTAINLNVPDAYTMAHKLDVHRQAKAELSAIKEAEMALRLDLVEALTKGNDKTKGTINVSRDGFKIKIKLGINISIDNEVCQQLIDDGLMSEEELACLRIKYELNAKQYKETDDTDTLDDIIISKPAAPSLNIELGE